MSTHDHIGASHWVGERGGILMSLGLALTGGTGMLGVDSQTVCPTIVDIDGAISLDTGA